MLKLVTGAWLLAAATQSMALTLGSVQGTAIIGQPLDLLVRSSVTAADTVSDLCLTAEVVYGNTPVAASDVSVTIQRLGLQESGALRLRVRPPVNEPVVAVTLLVGCRNPFRRQYTLLADFAPLPAPAEATPPPVAAPLPPVATPPAAAALPTPRPAPVAASAPAAPATEVLAPELPETPIRLSAPAPRPAAVLRLGSKFRPPAAVQEVPPQAAQGAVTAPLPRVEREAASGARLQLDPIDLSPTPSGAVLGQQADPAAPAQAAATDTPPAATGEAAADSPVVTAPTALEQELTAMRQEQEKMRLALESLNTQLQQAQADRYTNPLVMGLAGLALVLLLGLMWQLGRRPRR